MTCSWQRTKYQENFVEEIFTNIATGVVMRKPLQVILSGYTEFILLN